MNEHFGDVLKEYVERSQQTAGQLAKLTGIPRQTIISWLEGRVKRPRVWQDIVRLAAALRLYEEEADRLLQAAGQQTIGELLATAESQQDEVTISLLTHWRKLRDVQAAALVPAEIVRASPFQAPHHVANFVGRVSVLAEIKTAIMDGASICILQGMGGVGKTALSTQLAYDMRSHFPDGVLWANLSQTVQNGRLNTAAVKSILGTFAQAYGRDINDESDLAGRSRIVREVLANKQTLIVLDNAHGTEDVTPLLPPSTGGCTVLITTRNRKMLRSRAAIFAVAPFGEVESMALFRQLVGDDRIESEKQGARQIVALLGGLPLAVKVVASTLADTGSITLLEYVDLLLDERSRLEYLTDWEDASKDVRASFELSFNRLPGPLQKLFTHLALFAGSNFSSEAVAAVTKMPLVMIKTQLGRLCALSLVEEVQATKAPAAGGVKPQYRYHLHPLLRLFAQEKLQTSSDDLVELERHAAIYFIRFARDNQEDYHLLELDWGNIAGVLRWAQRREEWEHFGQGVAALTAVNLGVIGFLDARGYWSEATALLTTLLSSPVTADGYNQAIIHFKMGAFAFRQADWATAEERLHQSILLAKILPNNETIVAQVCSFMSQLTFRRGDVQDALAWSDRGIAALQTLIAPDARQEEGYLHIRRAEILARTGELDAASTATTKGISLLPSEPTLAKITGLKILGNILFFQGDMAGALDYWQENIGNAQAIGDDRHVAGLWQNIGAAETNRGHIARAVEPKEKALALYERMGDIESAAYMHSNLAEDNILLHDYESAHTHLTTALEMAQAHQLAQVELFALVNQVRWQLDKRQLTTAEANLGQADVLCHRLGLTQQRAEITRLQAKLAYHNGEYETALTAVAEALTLTTDPKERGLSWRLKGSIYRALADTELAEAAYQKSRDILADHNPFECARTLLALGQYYTGIHAEEKAEALLETALDTFERLQINYYTTETRTALGWQVDETPLPPDEAVLAELPPTPPTPATRFVRQELLATGGQGEVYLGRDTVTEQQVIIKRLRPELVAQNPDVVDRFSREAEALRQLAHPNIVKMLAETETEDGYIIVMEFVTGGSLHDLLHRQPRLSVMYTLDIALELADALSRTHHLGVIHRDLKPANVLLADDGTPRLTDFGIAYMTQHETRLTQEGAVLGTIAYMSPEACRGETADGRSDIWAFGVMLYEMLTGQHPFIRENVGATFAAILNDPTPDLMQIRPETPLSLIDLIERMLMKERERRIGRMRQIAAELEVIRDNLKTGS